MTSPGWLIKQKLTISHIWWVARDHSKHRAEEALAVKHHFSVHKIRINRAIGYIIQYFSRHFFPFFVRIYVKNISFTAQTNTHISLGEFLWNGMHFIHERSQNEIHMEVRAICCDMNEKNKSFVLFRSRQIINRICYDLCVAIYDGVSSLVHFLSCSVAMAHKR